MLLSSQYPLPLEETTYLIIRREDKEFQSIVILLWEEIVPGLSPQMSTCRTDSPIDLFVRSTSIYWMPALGMQR